MKKWKIAILSILVLGFVAFASYTAYLLIKINEYSIVPGDPVDYHTKEDLADLYWKNNDLLNAVKDSILSNKAFLQVLVDQKDGDAGISSNGSKDLFAEDEWADIVSVFEKLHPYMIMMERKGRPLTFYIVFGTLKQDSVEKTTLLYWFPNEDERIYHEKPGVFPDGVFTQIEDGWYIVEETRSR
jgi:hypothetical protein